MTTTPQTPEMKVASFDGLAKLNEVIAEVGIDVPGVAVVAPASGETQPEAEVAPPPPLSLGGEDQSEEVTGVAPPAPTTPTDSPPPVEDPALLAARKIIQRLGGDPTNPETWEDTLQSVAVPPSKDDIQVSPDEVEPWVQKRIEADPQVLQVDADHKRINGAIDSLNSEISRVNKELKVLAQTRQKAEVALDIPEVQDNPLRIDEIKQTLRDIRDAKRDFSEELRGFEEQKGKYETLKQQQLEWFEGRQDKYRGDIIEQLKGQKWQSQEVARRDQVVQSHLDNFQVKWPLAFEKLVQAHQIPEHKIPKLRADLKAYALAEPSSIDPNALEAFMAPHFKDMAASLGLSQAAQSKTYGTKAAERTRNVTAAPAGTPTERSMNSGDRTPSRQAPIDLEEMSLQRLRAVMGA